MTKVLIKRKYVLKGNELGKLLQTFVGAAQVWQGRCHIDFLSLCVYICDFLKHARRFEPLRSFSDFFPFLEEERGGVGGGAILMAALLKLT